MLVAVGMKSSKIQEIVCHNVRLSKQHLADLAVLVKTCDAIVSIKLDYIDFASEGEGDAATTLGGALLPLLAEGGALRSLSLKGGGLDSKFTAILGDSLMSLTSLEGLNLSENNINDEGLVGVLRALPFCLSLRQVSLRRNPITGAALARGVQDLLRGQPLGPSGEVAMKTLQKLAADRNKVIQAANKARKKAGAQELPELPLPGDRLVASPGEDSRVLARSLKLLDFSHCCFDQTCVSAFVSAAVLAQEGVAEQPAGVAPLTLVLRGVDSHSAALLAEESFSGKLRVQC